MKAIFAIIAAVFQLFIAIIGLCLSLLVCVLGLAAAALAAVVIGVIGFAIYALIIVLL
jgi:hypothetical protein